MKLIIFFIYFNKELNLLCYNLINRGDNMKYDWDLSLLCIDDNNWKIQYQKLNNKILELNKKTKNLLDNIDSFLEFINDYIDVNKQIEMIYCYPKRNLDLDIKNDKYKLMLNDALTLYQEILKIISIFENKLLDNIELVEKYLKNERCSNYRRYINLILRKKQHIISDIDYKSKYEEKIHDIKSKYQALFNNGFEIKDLSIGDKKVDVNRFNYNDLILDKNQTNRKIIFDAYSKEYEKCNEIIANLYLDKLKNDIELATKENYDSLLSKKLFELELDNNIVDSLIKKINDNLEVMHNYTKLKKEILNLDKLHFYDTSLSICSIPKITYSIEEAIQLIKSSLNILGEEYIKIIDSMFREGWIDVFPKKDKRSNSYTCISYAGVPYILINFDGTIDSVRTLAHEIGHAINVYYSKKNNNFEYFEFSYFLTEIASKVNELLFNEYMIKNCKNKEQKIYILNNIISSLGNSLFGQVMLTEFEHTIVKKITNKEEIDNNILNDIYLNISKKYNGNDMVYDDNIKYGWSKIQHFIMQDSYYLYQYSIGASIACNISKRIIDKEPGVLEKYIKFLSSGNSVSINEALSYLDIDLENGDYIDNAIIILDNSIKELKRINNKNCWRMYKINNSR